MMLDVQDALLLFGAKLAVRPGAYPQTPDGWGLYLVAVTRGGLRHFAPLEFISPVRGGLALPPPELWPRLALHALFADRFRAEAGVPVRIRYGWRDTAANAAVGGAPQSDHLRVALDLQTLGDRATAGMLRARERLVEALYRLPGLSMGYGEGRESITHVGLLSAQGTRRWKY